MVNTFITPFTKQQEREEELFLKEKNQIFSVAVWHKCFVAVVWGIRQKKKWSMEIYY